MIVEYVWLSDRPVAAVYPGNRIIYLTTDYQNKPRQGVDAVTQQVVWSWDPDAFGVNQPSGSVTINLRFLGQYYDSATGLYYNHNRYYNPKLGRYMEPDPTGLEAGLNPYAYAGNNPVMNTDPSGLIVPLIIYAAIDTAIETAPIWVRYVYLNAPRIAAFADGVLPSSAGSVGVAAGLAGVAARTEGQAARALPDSALVCRGGACKAESFANGSGVTQATDGTLQGVSTQSRANATVADLAKSFKNNQVGVTTAGKIRDAGGKVTADGHPNNPNHATVDNLSPQQLEGLFSPTVPNPVPSTQRGF